MKRFFLNSLFTLLALGVWGYANGLRPNNYEKFFSNLLDKYGIHINKTAHKKKPSKHSPQPESDGRDDSNREDIEEEIRENIRAENQETTEENSVNEVQPLPRNPFEDIDKRARQCPKKQRQQLRHLPIICSKIRKLI
jgi:hypothetical protein